MDEMVVRELRCRRCGHVWIPRQTKLPQKCPKCRSSLWNVERKTKEQREAERELKKVLHSLSRIQEVLTPSEYLQALTGIAKEVQTSLSSEEFTTVMLSLMQTPEGAGTTEKEEERA